MHEFRPLNGHLPVTPFDNMLQKVAGQIDGNRRQRIFNNVNGIKNANSVKRILGDFSGNFGLPSMPNLQQ